MRSDAEGEDLLQDCVEKMLVRRTQWRGMNLRGWALTIMTNLYRNAYRASSRSMTLDLDTAEHVPSPDAPSDPLERSRLEDALNGLPEENRVVLMLVAIEGFTYSEVAALLDIPIGTVMSRLARARQRIAARMQDASVTALRRPK